MFGSMSVWIETDENERISLFDVCQFWTDFKIWFHFGLIKEYDIPHIKSQSQESWYGV